jgi:insecticidal toxin complex protein TccC
MSAVKQYTCTPVLNIRDNQGLTVRTISYHRHPDSPDVTEVRLTRHEYDARGFLAQSADPRLYDAGRANLTYIADLAGNALRTQGVDNGTSVILNDAAGRPCMSVSNISTDDYGTLDLSQAVTRTWEYEESDMPGRPLSITEQVTGDIARISERFVWAGNSDTEKALNLAGQCISHYDTAGLAQTDSVSLTGMPLSVSRRLLKDADNPDTVADWQGVDASAWNDQLEAEVFVTLATADATGAALTTTDAKGNRQRVAYDVAGQLSGSWLTVTGGAEQVIVRSLAYAAAGQKLREEHGNGVVTTYTYEPQTQRLTGIKTERPAGHVAGAKVLQDLRYEYDPVGNVLKVRNDAESTRFWRNQKVVPENTYAYDSLYQLVCATGREMANAGQQGSSLPPLTVPLPTDSTVYTNYTRTYTYDSAGNLMEIHHSAPATNNNYTTNITVSDRSNRGVLSTLTGNPADVEEWFTAGGQQTRLQPGQTLTWTPRNELQTVSPVVREGAADDNESYRYDAGSQRLLKVSRQLTGGNVQTKRVLYLPGLELRTTASGETETESLQVITVGEAGRAQVRALHWESVPPNGLSNNQVRYSYDNPIGSGQLELDGVGNVISMEEYYPYGGTAVWTARSQVEADYKTVRYSGKERDATGLYYYGWRYYQPWAGRWLSADPAGTVDGLNLFRMVRNNPATLKDDNGLNPIDVNFREAEGDLVYGLATPRGAYISTAIGRPFMPDKKDAPASIIDLYNITVTGQALLSVKYDTLQKFMKKPNKYEKKMSPPPDIKERVKLARDYPLWESYFQAGERNPKFNIQSIYKEVRTSPGMSQYHEWHISAAQSTPKLLWKRGSKLGIEMAASGAGNKIHFVLDGLDISNVVSKEGPGGQSITASELRYAYRNRARLTERIHFYKDDAETTAPWETDPDLWASYHPKSEHDRSETTAITVHRPRNNLFTSVRRFFTKR